MGFLKVAEVPEGDRIGFAILVSGDAELVLQSTESVRNDLPALAPSGDSNAAMPFIETDDFAETKTRLEGGAAPERVTFYGMRETGVCEPGGHVVIFAAKEAH